jgi:predicted amidohydrolase YtcJ/ABC-type amino acid transport substrate-binding protein
MRSVAAAIITLCIFALVPAWAQTPDIVLVNGKILTVDDRFSVREALAIHGDQILALGTSADIRKTAGPKTTVIDLQGRVVIPGLIDSHLHAIRAGLTFSTEVNWVGVPTLTEALDRIRKATATMKPGDWVIVGGGWTTNQFKERRRPNQTELDAAAPNNPVYIQLGYSWVILSRSGFKALNISADADLPMGASLEKDAAGNLTGGINGNQPGIVALFEKLPKPTFDQQVDGTKKFFRELNRLALTGVGDPGGNNLTPAEYEAVFKVWRQHQMTIRVTYSLNGQTAGREIEELQGLARMLPAGFGDNMLRFNGFGERITWAMNNNDRPGETEKANYYQIARWAAERGMALTMHWNNNGSVDHLLTLFEQLNREVPITGLRWSIAHLYDASPESLKRIKALGMGWTVQDPLYFSDDPNRSMPPVMTAKRLGVPVGAGTDAHRIASYNPFTALQWFLDGKTVGGTPLRGLEDLPGREDALRFYTIDSAWFSRDEDKRGSLEVGKLADLSVLSKDYMTVPVNQIGTIESLLTMVGGKIVYAAGPYSQLEKQTADARAMRDVLAPTGTLRAVFLGSNPVQARVDPSGVITGPSSDIVRELANRLGVPFSLKGLDGVPAVMEAISKGTADIGFLAFDATRAAQVGFTQPYSIGHNTYMVRRDSTIQTVADADRSGVRIGVGAGDAVDLYLSRSLKQARIVRPANRTMEEAVRMLTAGELEAYAANRQRLTEVAAQSPNMRLIPGSVLGVQQSVVVAKDNATGISFLNGFIDDLRDSGFLRDSIGRANLAGVEVAPR